MPVLVSLLSGLFFFLGALVAWRARDRERTRDYSIAVAFGALACVAAIDLVPEVFEISRELGWPVATVLVIAGAVALMLLDRALPGHNDEHDDVESAHLSDMALVAITVHNLAEGAAIYAIASQDLSSGVAFAVGVGMHNAPMGWRASSPACRAPRILPAGRGIGWRRISPGPSTSRRR